AELDERLVDADRAGFRERLHLLLDPGGVAAARLEQRALEIRRDLDVHRRAERGLDLAALIHAFRQYTDHYVVGVGRDDELAGGETHPLRRLAGEDVAEIAGRHDEGGGTAELRGGGEVIDALRGDAREVDRVDRGQAHGAGEVVFGEQRLHDR